MPSSRIENRVSDLLADAREARDAGDWKTARSLLDAVGALDPGNAEAAAMLAGAATRRQMTLLFCDIVGSTELADQRDPEEVTAIIERYRTACAEVVDELDGYIDDHRGDGMLVLFGYPQVDEDDARRGVLCGLRMIERVRRIRWPGPGGAALQVRISVHTDLVVVADGITGSTANEAARIQQLADPDTVVISDTTQDLVWPWFETESLGTQPLRGVSRPVEVFAVRAVLPTPRGRTWRDRTSPFVNRTAEFSAMEWLAPKPIEVVEAAVPASGAELVGARAVCVIGPGGMGKTRLTLETARRLGLRPIACSCSRMQRNVSLHPFRQLLEGACGMDADDPAEIRLEKLRAALSSLPGAAEAGTSGDLPFLAAVFDIPLERLSAPSEVQPDRLRRQALLAAAQLVGAHAAAEPTLIFVDDVQWADQSSLDLLAVLLTMPALKITIAARDGFDPPWAETVVRRIVLDPLDEDATAELVRQTPSAAQLSPERSRELMQRSDGVPLFLEELLLTAQESDTGRIPHRSLQFSAYQIPPALRDPLLARLSRPEVDLELAQLAAVIGRDVDRDLLHRAVGVDGAEFERRLRTLLDAGLMELAGAQLRFRHELIREVAYETQRRTVLKERHGIIADLLASGDGAGQRATTVAAAFHLEQAGRVPHAVAAHIQIAQADQALGAHEEAAERLHQGPRAARDHPGRPGPGPWRAGRPGAPQLQCRDRPRVRRGRGVAGLPAVPAAGRGVGPRRRGAAVPDPAVDLLHLTRRLHPGRGDQRGGDPADRGGGGVLPGRRPRSWGRRLLPGRLHRRRGSADRRAGERLDRRRAAAAGVDAAERPAGGGVRAPGPLAWSWWVTGRRPSRPPWTDWSGPTPSRTRSGRSARSTSTVCSRSPAASTVMSSARPKSGNAWSRSASDTASRSGA